MSKVIFFSFPCCGHMYPALGLMRALVQRGEVLTIVSSEEFKDSIKAIGALYRDYGPEMDILQKNIYGQSGKITYLSYQLLVMSEKVIPRYLKSMKEQSPDYIIFDSMCVWGRFLAEIMNIPSICSISMFAYFRGYKDIFTRKCSEIFYNAFVEQNYIEKREYKKKFNEVETKIRKQYHINKSKVVDVMSNIGDMNIVYTIKQLQPLSLLFDKRFLFIGASISERNEINDFEIKKDKWKKVIYISLGSIFCDNKFYQMCFEVLKDTDYLVILKVGDQISVDVNEIPDNFIVRKFVAQLEVLKVADLIVCHGGMNSVSEALYFEVPVIAIPHSSDQPFVAKQIDKLKCGLHLEKKQLTKEVLKRSIDSVLNNARYKKNCIKVSESMKKAGGHKYAVDSIFQFKKRNILSELQEEAYSGEKQDRM